MAKFTTQLVLMLTLNITLTLTLTLILILTLLLTLTLILALNCYNAFPMPASGYSYRDVRFWNPAFLRLKNIRHRYICITEEKKYRRVEILDVQNTAPMICGDLGRSGTMSLDFILKDFIPCFVVCSDSPL